MKEDDLDDEAFVIRFGLMKVEDVKEAIDRCFVALGFYGLSFYGEKSSQRGRNLGARQEAAFPNPKDNSRTPSEHRIRYSPAWKIPPCDSDVPRQSNR